MKTPRVLADWPKNLVTSVEGNVTKEEIDTWGRYQEIQDKSYRMRSIIETWRGQQELDRRLRKIYATIMVIALFIEIVFSFTVILLIGYEKIRIDQWVANVFFTAVFAQTAAMIMAIVKYLFPPTNVEFLKLLEKV
jgi:hypothetical protein